MAVVVSEDEVATETSGQLISDEAYHFQMRPHLRWHPYLKWTLRRTTSKNKGFSVTRTDEPARHDVKKGEM